MIRILVYSNPKAKGRKYGLTSLLSNIPNLSFNFVGTGIKENIKNLLSADIVQIMSAKLNGIEDMFWIFLFVFFKIIGKKILFYWIGSDVMDSDKKIVLICSKLIDKNLVHAPWLVNELKEKGVVAEFAPIPSWNIRAKKIGPLPETPTALVYFGNREYFYGLEIVRRLVSMPYKFIILGKRDVLKAPNIEYLGHVNVEDMDEIYSRTTVLLRITKHDALSKMVQEALARGRYVIWSYKFPNCLYATDYDMVYKHMRELENVKQLNTSGISFINNYMNMNKCVKIFTNVYNQTILEKK